MTGVEQLRDYLDGIIKEEMASCGLFQYERDAILDYLLGLAKENGVVKIADITPEDELKWNLRNPQKTAGVEHDSLQYLHAADIIGQSLRGIVSVAVAAAS